MIVRTPERQSAIEKTVLSSFAIASPCERKENFPPGDLFVAIDNVGTAIWEKEESAPKDRP